MTITQTFWMSISIAGYREVEVACDYYYDQRGKYTGSSGLYFTKNYR